MREVLAANITDPVAADGVSDAQNLAGNTSLLRKNTASWKEFQPRVGFAWDPTGSGRFVVRGGYGVARDQIFQNLTLFSIQQTNPTLYQTALDLTANGSGTTCVPSPTGTPETDLCQFSFGKTPLPSPNFSPTELAQGGTGRIIGPRLDDPWSQQMSIGGAWQFNKDYAFTADYYHVIGNPEPRVLQQNPVLKTLCDPAFPISNPADPRCVNGAGTRLLDAAFVDDGLEVPGGTPRIGEVRDYSTNTRSLYDGINLTLKRRFSRNFQFQVSDVISWARGWAANLPPPTEVAASTSPRTVNFYPANSEPPTSMSAIASPPAEFSSPLRLRGCPIFQASTGRPYTALAGSDLDGDGRSTIDRARVDGSQTPGCTEVHPNTFRGKPYIELDLRTAYAFKIRENMKFRILWEMYNIGNRANSCNNVDTHCYGGTCGAPQGYCGGQGPGATFGGPYRSQFGFRFEF